MIKKTIICFVIILSGLNVAFAAEDYILLSTSSQSLTVKVTPDKWQLQRLDTPEGVFTKAIFNCAQFNESIGEPLLPKRILTIGVPPKADVSVQIIDTQFKTLSDIKIAPGPQTEETESGYVRHYEPNADVYQKTDFLPQNLVDIEAPVPFRSGRIAQIVVHPFQYAPGLNTARQYTQITFRITFSSAPSQNTQPERVSNDDIFQNLVINKEQAKNWTMPARQKLAKASTSFQGENWYKISISTTGNDSKEGFYKITGQTLQDKNIPISEIDPSTIQLFNNGGKELSRDVTIAKDDELTETPILVVGGEDGRFDPSDYILFYGRSLTGKEFDSEKNQLRHYIHRFAFDNIYWLTYGKEKGRRIEKRSSLPLANLPVHPHFRDVVWIEEEKHNIYHSGATWLGYELARNKNSYSMNFQLQDVVPEEEASFRFSIAAASYGQHQFGAYANGNFLGSFEQLGGSKSYTLNEHDFSTGGVLMDGDNTVSINYTTGSQIMFAYVNWIEVEYKRRFRARNSKLIFHSPLQEEPARYQLQGLSASNARIFDVTHIDQIAEIEPASGTGDAIEFADQSLASDLKRYVAIEPGAFVSIDTSAIKRAEIAHLRSKRQTEYIIIVFDDFYQQALQVESLREDWSPKSRIETKVVKYSSVINEFGWGIPDPAAIRNFLAYAQLHWGEPQYVLLLGDGHFDYKNILNTNTPNLIIPYETDGHSYYNNRTSDDWFTYTKGVDAGMQMAIGRMCVQTVDEAQGVVDKLIEYETNPDFGEWLKTITVVADDELTEGGVGTEDDHTQQAETLSEYYVPDLLDVKKIYLMNYPAVRTASVSGVTKPAATDALLEQINRGTLILNYIGHGNDDLWAHERVLLRTRDFDKIQNGKRMAMWVAATCEFAQWDQAEEQSLAEDVLNARGRGAVSMVASARLAFSSDNAAFNYRLYRKLFQNYQETGQSMRIGDAVLLAKKETAGRVNKEKYTMFGDPAMRLCTPRFRAVIDDIEPDSIQALSRMNIRGHIEKENEKWPGFNGKMKVKVLDTRKEYTYTMSNDWDVNYMMDGNTLFRGMAKITDGQFDVRFIVPKDISYGGSDGRISLYFWNDEHSGTGNKSNINVGGTAVNLVDNQGPYIKAYFNDPDFVPGDYVSTRPTLHVEINDSLSGVNTAGDVGHQIKLTIDEDFANSKDITEFFSYDEGSYTSGALDYTLYDLPLGEHTVHLKAWDNSNNSSVISTRFVVVDNSELEIRNPLTYPNPMTDDCTFRFELSQNAEVSIKVYTVAGRLVKKYPLVPFQVGYNVYPESWDGRDQSDDVLANGVYFFKIHAKTANEEKTVTADKIGKLIIAR